HRRGFLPDADDEQQQCKHAPRNAVTHVARESSRELKGQRSCAGCTEVIGELDVHEQESKHRAQCVKQREGIATEYEVARRCEKARGGKKTNSGDATRKEIPDENRSRRATKVAEE